MKKITEFFKSFSRNKEIIKKLELALFEAESEIEYMRNEINNFPPCAIAPIPNDELTKALNGDPEQNVANSREVVAKYFGLIEMYDLKVDYMLLPTKLYNKFCKVFGCKKSIWGVKIVSVSGLNSTILLSNIKCENV